MLLIQVMKGVPGMEGEGEDQDLTLVETIRKEM